MADDEIVERVAQALHLHWMASFDGGNTARTPFTMLDDDQKAFGYAQARAAILACADELRSYSPDAAKFLSDAALKDDPATT